MATIKEMAEEYCKSTLVGSNYIKGNAYETGANAVLEKIDSLIENTSGEGEVYHYNLYIGLQKLVKKLKGE